MRRGSFIPPVFVDGVVVLGTRSRPPADPSHVPFVLGLPLQGPCLYGSFCLHEPRRPSSSSMTMIHKAHPPKNLLLLKLLRCPQGRDRLSLGTSKFHLFLELLDIANSRKEVWLSSSIGIKGSKPTVPFPFGCLGFLEVANHREFFRRKEAIVDNGIVLPAIDGTRHVIVRLALEPRTLLQIEMRSLDVVEFKAVFFKDATDSKSLDPKEGGKEDMKATSHDSDQRWTSIKRVCYSNTKERQLMSDENAVNGRQDSILVRIHHAKCHLQGWYHMMRGPRAATAKVKK